MARSAKIHPERKPQILQAIKSHGFLTQGYLANHLEISLSTVNNFVNSKPVYISKFEEICDVLELNPQEIIKPLKEKDDKDIENKINLFSYDSFLGRTRKNCRKINRKIK